MNAQAIPQTAVITGGASGIGKATAFRLAEAGITPVIMDFNEQGAHHVAQEISDKYGLPALAFAVDVADENSVVMAFGRTVEAIGSIGYVVHSAGITKDGLMARRGSTGGVVTMSFEQWSSVINVNLHGTFLVLKQAVEWMMRNQHPGSIVALSSVSANGNVGQTNYSASKAGVRALVTALAAEVAREGIRVNSLAPGFTDTPMTEDLQDKVRAKVERTTMLSRFAEVEEIATAIYNILVTETYVTGQDRVIDGGMTFGLKML